MMIRRLKITNMLSISALEIEAGQVNVLRGSNGAGKSTVLESVHNLLVSGGIDPSMITTDAKKGEILAEFTDGTIVSRAVTRNGPKPATVKGDTGDKTPAEFLADLVAGRLLKPVEFVRMCKSKAKGDQRTFRNAVLELIPFQLRREDLEQHDIPEPFVAAVDYEQHGLDALEQLRQRIYDERHRLGQRRDEKIKAQRDIARDLPEDFDAEAQRGATATKVAEQLSAAREWNKSIETDGARLEEMTRERKQAKDDAEAIKQQIAALQEKLEAKRELWSMLNDAVKGLQADLGNREPMETDALVRQLEDYEAGQRLLTLHDRAAGLAKEKVQLDARYQDLTELHDMVRDDLPRALLEPVPMPIPDLRWDEDVPYVGEKAMRNLSTGELMRIAFDCAVADGRNRGATVDVVLVDDFEHLDDSMQDEVVRLIEAHPDVQFWCAVVGSGQLEVESAGEVQ